MHKRAIAVGIVLAIILLVSGRAGRAAPLAQGQAVVTYPTDGAIISGVVQVTGIATHPDILWYDVSYASGPDATAGTQWVSLARVENTRVENGVLAIWDTTGLPDGEYCLALTVVGRGDSFTYQQIVRDLTVDNTRLVASPTPEEATPTPSPLPTVVIVPTPTPVTIEQPPTVTPPPSRAQRIGEEMTPDTAERRSRPVVDMAGLRNAFCTGGLVVLMLFVLLGLYQLARALIRWYLRGRRPL